MLGAMVVVPLFQVHSFHKPCGNNMLVIPSKFPLSDGGDIMRFYCSYEHQMLLGKQCGF